MGSRSGSYIGKSRPSGSGYSQSGYGSERDLEMGPPTGPMGPYNPYNPYGYPPQQRSGCCCAMIIIGSMLAGLGVIFACLYFGGFIFQGKNRWAQPTVKFTDSEERSCGSTVKRLIQNSGGLGISGDNVRQAHKAAALKPGAKGAIKLSDGKAVKVSVDKNRVIKIDPSQTLNAKQKEEITKELAKRAPARMPQLCDKAGHKIETTSGLFLKSEHKEIKSESQAKKKNNVYKIKKDGRDILVKYTKLCSNNLWYCARCVNMIDSLKGLHVGDVLFSKLKNGFEHRLRIRNHAAEKGAYKNDPNGHRGYWKGFVGKGCLMCEWTEDVPQKSIKDADADRLAAVKRLLCSSCQGTGKTCGGKCRKCLGSSDLLGAELEAKWKY